MGKEVLLQPVWHLSNPEPPTREGPGVQLVSREAVKADAGQAGRQGDEEYGHHQPHRHHRHSHHAHLHLLHHTNHIRNSSIQCFRSESESGSNILG